MKKSILLVLVFALTFSMGSVSTALAEYPERPITFVVPFRAGGNIDTVARLLAKSVGDTLGQPLLPVNKAGRGGGVGATALKNEKPDGYTIGLFVGSAFTFNPVIGKTKYTIDDFKYICNVTHGQEAFVTGVDRPWKDWKGMIKAGKEKGGLTCSSFAPYIKLFLKDIGKQEGVKITPVPTKGGAGMVPQILGGHVDFAFSGGIHHSYAKAGKMITLASVGPERLKHFPDVPTLKELGYKMGFSNLVVVAAPKGIPGDIVNKLSNAFEKAVKSPDVADLIENKVFWPVDYRASDKITADLYEQVKSNKALADSLK